MKYKLLLISFFACGLGWGQIIISQVYEGASNNKWIEITNVGNSSVDLSTPVQYKFGLWSVTGDAGNGSISGTPTSSISLTGSLSAGAKFLIRNTSSSTTVPHNPMPSGDNSNATVAGYNGNDAIAIFTGTNTIVDAFGHGINNKDISYHRNSNVLSANASFTISEWTSKSLTEVANATSSVSEYIGTHIYNSSISSTTFTTSWSNSAPTASLDAIISGNLTTTTDLACKDLTINSGNTLTIGAGKKLTVAGNLINNGTIVFKSDASGTAMFDVFNGAQSGTGVVTAERYIPARRAFRFVSSPVTTTTTIKQNWQENAGTTAGLGTHITGTGGATNGFDVTGTNNPSMYTFANGSWAAVTNTNVNVLTAGTPYRLMVRGDRTTDLTTNTPTATATTLRSTGALQTGNLTVNLSSTANDVNFVANPYQAPIYAGVIFGSGSNYTNVNPLDFYIWDPALGSRGAYSTVSISNGQATAGSSHTNLIYPWEAFFVRTSTNGAASITFKEAYKTEPNLGSARTLAVDNRFLKLNLKGLQTNGTWNYVDGIRFDFASQFSNEVNTEDAQKLFNLDEDLAIQKDNAALFSVERRLLPETQETVSLHVSKYRTTSYVFENQAQNITGVQAFLKDNFTNTMHELNGTAYPFTVDTAVPASTHANRFDIVFIPSALATPSETAAITLYPNPTKRGEGFYLQGINKAQVTVYNVLGQNIPVQVKSQGNALQVTPTQTLSQGIYLVTVTTEGKTQQVKWIVE